MDTQKADFGWSVQKKLADRQKIAKKYLYSFGILLLACGLLSGCSDTADVIDDDALTNGNGELNGQQSDSTTPSLQVPADLFQLDGYDTVNVIRADVKTETTPGICTSLDLSGCTFADVNADVNANDDLTVEIPVRFQAADYPDAGVANAELRQRGATSRSAPQKSYRVKLEKDAMLWRNEQRLQLNKHPLDITRIRNKLSFDLMSNVPNLPSLRTQFVNLWVDDGQGPVDFGLFTHVEAVKKEFLQNRGWNEGDHIYKAEQFAFSANDLSVMTLDEAGAPLNLDLFEERLSIETGSDDHSQLIKMLTDINDPAQSFDSVLDRYFDRDNVLMWVTVNFLLGQKDVTTHNFYLYNPVGTEKFYFLPWDYDASFYFEIDPPDSFATEALIARLFYGYARGANSVFLDRYFRLPGMNDTIINAANMLRDGVLSDTVVTERVARYASVVRPYVTQQPDIQHLPTTEVDPIGAFEAEINRLAGYVTTNHQTLQAGLGIPMPPTLEAPVKVADQIRFSWRPAYDVTGSSISYDIQVATDVGFSADTVVFNATGIADAATQVQYSVPATSLPQGPLFYRVIARASSDPQRLWQVANNLLVIDGVFWYGIVSFDFTNG